jgi:hypothetical protein
MSMFVIRSRSSHPFALVAPIVARKAAFVDGAIVPPVISGARLVGYAASQSPAVKARARRLGARIVPIIDGKVEVSYEVAS